eukprot:jgi/Mesvir1/18460/Mv14315-RA.1
MEKRMAAPAAVGKEQEVTRSMGVVDAFSAEELREETERMEKLTGYHKDYSDLRALLDDLPTKVSHPIMVPFGRHAFFPGRLVHSNELMVYLGDKYYVQRSCKQTVEIIKRREEYLEKSIDATKKRIQGLRDMTTLTDMTGLRGLQQEEEGFEPVEIMEEYDSEDEKRDKKAAEVRKRPRQEGLIPNLPFTGDGRFFSLTRSWASPNAAARPLTYPAWHICPSDLSVISGVAVILGSF